MFDFLKRKQKPSSGKKITLPFKSNQGAFEYCCRFMNCAVGENVMFPAIVVDSAKEFGTATSVSKKPDGIQLAAVKVPSDDGGFVVMAETLSNRGPLLKPGQLVAWRAMMYSQEVGGAIQKAGGDKRSGWIGVIFATLEPTWKNGVWLIDQKFLQ